MDHTGLLNTGTTPDWSNALVSIKDDSVSILLNDVELFSGVKSQVLVESSSNQDGSLKLSVADEFVWFRPNNVEAFWIDWKGATTMAERAALAALNANTSSAQAPSFGPQSSLNNPVTGEFSKLPGHEKVVERTTVRSNLLFVWLTTRLELTTHRIRGIVPNTVLGAIPAGAREVTQPLNNVSQVSIDTRVSAFRGILALLSAILAMKSFGGSPVIGLLLLVAAAYFAALTLTASLTIADTSGRSQDIPVSLLDKARLQQFADEVNRRVSGVL